MRHALLGSAPQFLLIEDKNGKNEMIAAQFSSVARELYPFEVASVPAPESQDDVKCLFAANWLTIRRLAAAVLLIAAAMKVHQMATQPVAHSEIISSQWLILGLVGYELFLATWLLSGVWPKRARFVSLVTFAGFGVVSLLAALQGDATCGCFGHASPRPIYTALLDAAIATLVWKSKTHGDRNAMQAPRITALAWSCVAVTVTLTIAWYMLPDDERSGSDNKRLVTFEPEKWLGKRFPLFKHLLIDADLERGTWLVFVHQHGCLACSRLVPRYVDWAKIGGNGAFKLAFIEVPPLGDIGRLQLPSEPEFASGRLVDRFDWFIHTPNVIRIKDGILIAIENPETLLNVARITPLSPTTPNEPLMDAAPRTVD